MDSKFTIRQHPVDYILSSIKAFSNHQIAGLLAPSLTSLAIYVAFGPIGIEGDAFAFLSSTAGLDFRMFFKHFGSFLFQTGIAFLILEGLGTLLSPSPVRIALVGFTFVALGVFLIAAGVTSGSTNHPSAFWGFASFAIGFSTLRPYAKKKHRSAVKS